MIDVSIIIVSYNTRKLLADCLATISAGVQGFSAETLVVDNASSDGSGDMVARDFDWVRLIHNNRNAGFAAANNMAIREAKGRYILLLNSDTRLYPGAVAEMIRFMDEHPRVGYCGPCLLNPDGSHQPSARRFPTVLSAGFSTLGLTHRFPSCRHTSDLHGLHGDRRHFRADWLSGACLMVRRDVLSQVGLLDEGFFMYFEETDWCRSMAQRGWEGWYVPTAKVVHLGGGSVVSGNGVRPFAGAQPQYWVHSSRRYMRRYHGFLGAVTSDSIQLLLYTLVWLRHRPRRTDRSRIKAHNAAATIRYLLHRAQNTVAIEKASTA